LAKPFGQIIQLFGEPIALKPEDDYDLCVKKLKNSLDKLEKEVEARVAVEKK
jgi:hypothetical protein